MILNEHTAEIRHFHLFAGLGGGARGFNAANPRVGKMTGVFRCLGGIDVDAGAIADFTAKAGVRGTVLDLFSRDQFIAFHGKEPPAGWREATVDDVRKAAGGERPHIVFTSPPCKGFSGLLSEGKSKTAKYQALNALTLRGVWLTLEAWADDLPELLILENVPRIANRGRRLLDEITALLRAYGYAVAETKHDCGLLGGLAQSRKRFLLVARQMAKVPPFLYQPQSSRLRGVGDVLGRLPLPGDAVGGPMHRVPSLQWQTWVRLAFVEAGGDWRSLNKLAVRDGVLADYLLAPELRSGGYGVCGWDETMGAVAGESLPSNGKFSVADPRNGVLGVTAWDEPAGAVAARSGPTNGAFSVADPRYDATGNDYGNLGVLDWQDTAPTIRAVKSPYQGAFTVADPRPNNNRQFANVYRIVQWDSASPTVIGTSAPHDGALSVADPRCGVSSRVKGDHYLTGAHYGVVPWQGQAGAVSAAACHDNGAWSVADPRLPAGADRLVCVIRSLDGTWHRPFTTLELAALQSLVDPEDPALTLQGDSDQIWRERIGNAVPPDAAQAIAETMGRTLLMAWSGEGFKLSLVPIWVQPVAVAISVKQEGDRA